MATAIGAEAAPGDHQPMPAVRTRGWRTALARQRATVLSLLALTLLSFVQRPGQVTFDTKIDLTVDPLAFLGRALHLWDPQSTFGQLQNQAYGYLFPQGSFFAVLHAVAIPGWISQRLWCALLLGAAFLGMLRLSDALGIGTAPARYIGAFAYALAPRMLTEIGPVSAELLPAVCLPWVLLPLVRADRFRSPRRAAAMSGLAVFAMSGVNAAIVAMALPLPVLWLLTRRWTREHIRLVAWWCLSVVLATLWWIIPLLLLGRYSPPFLNYVESAANTTAPLSAFEALRGTSQWVAYVIDREPWWPAGWALVDSPALMLATGLIVAIGLAGLTRRSLPERPFLILGVLTGLVLLTLGHVGPLDSPVAPQWQHLLDGALAPLRNVHKFDPVLRLCLVLGFVHGIGVAWSRPWLRRAELWVAGALVFVVAAPAWLLLLRPGPGWREIPPYWQQAADWLGTHDARSRTLLLPAAGFGEYTWGRTVDEPMQALARSPWAARSQVPLGSEGNTRFLDAVEAALADGRGSPALADYLARVGVGYLLLRDDLDRSRVGGPPAAVVRAALGSSAGIARQATFGPLEIYAVHRRPTLVTAVDAVDAVQVSGAPESVLELLEQGLLAPAQPVVLAGDPGAGEPGGGQPGGGQPGASPAGRWIITDGLRRTELNPGRVRDNTSQTLAASDPVRLERPTLGLGPVVGGGHYTVARYHGVRAVWASTALGYADAFGPTDPSHQPFAAIDGDPHTYWRSSGTGPVGQWLEFELDTPRLLPPLQIRFVNDLRVAWPVARIRISTDGGSRDYTVLGDGSGQQFTPPAGVTSRVRVTVLDTTGSDAGGVDAGDVGIAEIAFQGFAASRALRVPHDGDTVAAGARRQPAALSFSRGSQPRAACIQTSVGPSCDLSLLRTGEEPLGIDREFRLDRAASYEVVATALPRQSGTDPPIARGGVTVSASSQLASDPLTAPQLVLDGNPDTAWVADVSDLGAALHLRWQGARRIDQLRLTFTPAAVAHRPVQVLITAGTQQRQAVAWADGVVSFPAVTTDRLDMVFPQTPARFLAGPVGIAELDVPALRDLLAARGPTAPQCGSGPGIEVDGTVYQTAVDPRPSTQPVPLRLCGDLGDGLALRAGDHRIRSVPSARYVVQDLVLRPRTAAGGGAAGGGTAGGGAAGGGAAGGGTAGGGAASGGGAVRQRDVEVRSWGTVRRELRVGAGPEAYLVIPENANAGWVATLDGRPLRATRVDGWQQAWILPAGGAGTVTVAFAPDRTYRLGLLVGVLAALLLVVAAALPPRRRAERSPERSAVWGRAERSAVPASVRPGTWALAATLVLLVGLLAGLPLLLALAVFVLLRRLWWGALPAAALVAVLAATGAATAGRLLGHGQEWALGAAAQVATLVAVAAVVASGIRPPPGRHEARLFLD